MGQAARSRIRRAGRTPRGDLLWTAEEDDIVRRWYPDYRALQRALKRRSYPAIRVRAGQLNVVKRRHVWTTREVSFLRRHYLTTATAELKAVFPD